MGCLGVEELRVNRVEKFRSRVVRGMGIVGSGV